MEPMGEWVFCFKAHVVVLTNHILYLRTHTTFSLAPAPSIRRLVKSQSLAPCLLQSFSI